MKRNHSDGNLKTVLATSRTQSQPVVLKGSAGHRNSLFPDQRDVRRDYEMNLIERQRKLNQEIYSDNNGWNHYLELIAAQIGEKAAGLKWMHERSIAYFNMRYQVLGIIVILVQTAAATGSVTQISTCSSSTNIVTIFVSILMYLTAVCSSFQQFKNYGARTQSHKQAMTDFSSTEQMIRIELGKYRRDRKHGGDWTEWMGTRFDEVNATSPQIPGSIQKEYQTTILGKNVADNYKIDPIKIRGNTPSPHNANSNSGKKGNTTDDSRNRKISSDTSSASSVNSASSTGTVPDMEMVPLEIAEHEPAISNDEQTGDAVINFTPVIELGRQRYELERFLRGQ